MKEAVKTTIRACEICQKIKGESIHRPGLLQPLPMPGKVWEGLSMDFVEGLPSSGSFTTVLVVVDKFSKFSHFIPVKHPIFVQQLSAMFTENIIKLYGLPKSIVSDRDQLFAGEFCKEMFQL